MKQTYVVFILAVILLLPLNAQSEASWVKKKWHGEGGVIYLTDKGYLLRSWKGGYYFPMKKSSKDASWVKKKWHGEGGVIYLTDEGYLLRSWAGGYYFPME